MPRLARSLAMVVALKVVAFKVVGFKVVAQRVFALSVVVALCVVVTAPPAHAFSVSTVVPGSKSIKRWFDGKIPYLIHSAGSDDLPFATVKDVLKKGFAGWMEPSCSGLEFYEGYHCNTALKKCLYDGGAACSSDSDCPASKNTKVIPMGYNPNGRNELIFAETSAWKHGTYVLGVTSAWANNWQGAIVEADIAFNGYQQKWTTNPNLAGNGTQHLLSVAIHEQGHFFGVMHMLGGWSKADPPTMAPNVMPYDISATLNPDDKKAACFLNPKGGTHSCGGDSDCPYIVSKNDSGKESYAAKLSCQASKCVWAGASVGGNKPIGSECVSDSECASTLFCQPVGGGLGYCAKTCVVQQANCPGGFTCYPYQGTSGQGVCLKPFGGGSQKDVGAPCSSNSECKSLVCAGGTCGKACTIGQPGVCGSEQICESLPGGGGVCVAKKEPSLKDISEECSAPEECASGVCMKNDIAATVGYCRSICTTPGSCPDGFQCVSQGEGYTGCIPGQESIASGQPCSKDSMCKGGLCIAAGDAGSVCSNSCDVADPTTCPCGMVCAAGAKGVACYLGKPVACVPDGKPCAADGECISSVCKVGACQPGCSVGAVDGCSEGYSCLRIGAGVKGYCDVRGKVAEGNFCVSDAVCASLLCAKDAEGIPRCQDPCIIGESATCDAGEVCVATEGGVGRCEPAPPGGADGGAAADISGGADGNSSGGVPGTYYQPAPSSSCSAAAAPLRPGSAAGWGLALAAALLTLSRRRWRRGDAAALEH